MPFLLAVVRAAVGAAARRFASDTVTSLSGRERSDSLTELLQSHGRPLLLIVLVDVLTATGAYLVCIFLPLYLQELSGLGLRAGIAINTASMAALLAAVPLGGALCDRYGRRAVLAASAAMLAVLAVPMFVVIGKGNVGAALAGQLVLALPLGIFQVRPGYSTVVLACFFCYDGVCACVRLAALFTVLLAMLAPPPSLVVQAWQCSSSHYRCKHSTPVMCSSCFPATNDIACAFFPPLRFLLFPSN